MKSSLIRFIVRNQHLAAPDGTIFPVARAVERHANDRLRPVHLMLSHASRDMSMVMLYADGRNILTPGALQNIARRKIVRMQIIGDRFRSYPEQLLEMFHTLFKGSQCFVIFHVANMVAQKCIIPVCDTESVF